MIGFHLTTAGVTALSTGLKLAAQFGVNAVVVHAREWADSPPDVETQDWEAKTFAKLELTEEMVAQQAATAGIAAAQWTYAGVTGDPAKVLASVALQQKATMIVIGIRLSRFGPGRSGRIARRLLKAADCPTLLVPAPPRRR